MKKPTSNTAVTARGAAMALLMASAMCATAPASAEPQDGGDVIAGPASGAVRSIALAPDDGPLGGALAREFRNRGYTVVDGKSLAASSTFAQLKAQGVDAVLTVRTAGAEDQPQAAAAQINSTVTGAVMAKTAWRNGWGGWGGSKASLANRVMHKTLAQAAREIADDLVKTLT